MTISLDNEIRHVIAFERDAYDSFVNSLRDLADRQLSVRIVQRDLGITTVMAIDRLDDRDDKVVLFGAPLDDNYSRTDLDEIEIDAADISMVIV